MKFCCSRRLFALRLVLVFWLLLVAAAVYGTAASGESQQQQDRYYRASRSGGGDDGGFGGFESDEGDKVFGSGGGEDSSGTKWSSMFSIDPSRVLPTLLDAGNVWLPESVRDDVDVLKKVLKCDRAELNVLKKHLILHNVQVGIEDDRYCRTDGEQRQQAASSPSKYRPALKLGRVYMSWDSYSQNPCLDVEIEGVDVLVEFPGLNLKENNWIDLQDAGFPPNLIAGTEEGDPSSSSPFSLRFNSIDLLGDVTVTLSSRLLQRDAGILKLDLTKGEGFNDMLRRRSMQNYQRTGVRGCTSEEVADLVQPFFVDKIKRFAKQLTDDPAKAKDEVMKTADRVLDAVKYYASDEFQERSKRDARDAVLDFVMPKDDERIQDAVQRYKMAWDGLRNAANQFQQSVFAINPDATLTYNYDDDDDDDQHHDDDTKKETIGGNEQEPEIIFPDW